MQKLLDERIAQLRELPYAQLRGTLRRRFGLLYAGRSDVERVEEVTGPSGKTCKIEVAVHPDEPDARDQVLLIVSAGDGDQLVGGGFVKRADESVAPW